MMYLGEYRSRAALLADHLPWAALIAPGIVLNKDGSLQRSFSFRGPDLESATDSERLAMTARLNNMLRRFGSGWAIFFEAQRRPAPGYPQSRFPDAASALVDQERRAAFLNKSEPWSDAYSAKAGHGDGLFESRHYLTLLWLPPVDDMARLRQLLFEQPGHSDQARPGQGADAASAEILEQSGDALSASAGIWRERLSRFVTETDRAADLLAGWMPEFTSLDDQATLSYLHSTVSARRHSIRPPNPPLYLDGLLADTPFTGGLAPMLGGLHLRALTLLGFPDLTRPGILDELNQLKIGYRWVSRFIALDKPAAQRELMRLRRQWFAKRKSVIAILREVLYQEPVALIDSDAENKTADADQALQALGSDHVSFGYLTTSITLAEPDANRAQSALRGVEKVLHGAGFATITETVNAVEAWLGSLPGHAYANIRRPLVHSLNLAHLVPLSATWAGPEGNDHLKGPPLLLARGRGATPFRFSTHSGDVGHTMIIGPTGAGKSVLLALMALQFRRYAQARVVMFDKGMSARAVTLGCGGLHVQLQPAGSRMQGGEIHGRDLAAFQPLARIDEPAERSFALTWLCDIVLQENVTITPELRETLWSALTILSNAPNAERTLTGLRLLLPPGALRAALQPYSLEGAFGGLLDGSRDLLTFSGFVCFEMEEVMQQRLLVLPLLSYLFHRLDAEFDGRPTMLILDEAWLFLDHPRFAGQIRDWLKTLRKKNVSVIFATQSLSDIAESPIAATIIESCPQRLFLANDRAIEPQIRSTYERFGLNDRQLSLIAEAEPRRDYYLQSTGGNRLFELDLGPLALSLCAGASPQLQRLIDDVWDAHPGEEFLPAFLAARGLSWAAELARNWQPDDRGRQGFAPRRASASDRGASGATAHAGYQEDHDDAR